MQAVATARLRHSSDVQSSIVPALSTVATCQCAVAGLHLHFNLSGSVRVFLSVELVQRKSELEFLESLEFHGVPGVLRKQILNGGRRCFMPCVIPGIMHPRRLRQSVP